MNARKLVNETPTVVGMLTASLQSGGSVDTAVRTVSETGPVQSRELFQQAVRLADTKGCASVVSGLTGILENLPDETSGYVRAVLLSLSAAESSDADSRDVMLRDSANMALDAVRELGESYGASLTIPCMTVFGLGIIVPMIMMSIIPMLNIGGMFGSATIDQSLIAMTALALIPSVILAVALMIRSRNPFLDGRWDPKDLRCVLPLLVSVPLALLFPMVSDDQSLMFIFALVPACVAAALLMADVIHLEKSRRACEQSMMGAVFDIGNRMLAGSNFENAVVGSLRSSEATSAMAEGISREFALCRGDVRDAISRSVSPVSAEMCVTMDDIYVCSTRDNNDAGEMAMTLGRQFQSRMVTQRDLSTRLKSTTDMMLATAMFFAPMVLGMSVSMLEPLSRIAGYASMENSSVILEVYLVELSALISVLLSSLGQDNSVARMIWGFCIICPVSLLVFTACVIIVL